MVYSEAWFKHPSGELREMVDVKCAYLYDRVAGAYYRVKRLDSRSEGGAGCL